MKTCFIRFLIFFNYKRKFCFPIFSRFSLFFPFFNIYAHQNCLFHSNFPTFPYHLISLSLNFFLITSPLSHLISPCFSSIVSRIITSFFVFSYQLLSESIPLNALSLTNNFSMLLITCSLSLINEHFLRDYTSFSNFFFEGSNN